MASKAFLLLALLALSLLISSRVLARDLSESSSNHAEVETKNHGEVDDAKYGYGGYPGHGGYGGGYPGRGGYGGAYREDIAAMDAVVEGMEEDVEDAVLMLVKLWMHNQRLKLITKTLHLHVLLELCDAFCCTSKVYFYYVCCESIRYVLCLHSLVWE
ncbi:uncharacterized protein LOC129296401 [Prosopis cineraria]|uniref:uncharacterized protein LOC129296401 n=1 Tax=Prosopis cineraria TaxID=364024 RepID=UPI00240F0951|nr:uncharacterized protein LOC129296401 [Prosopis cineraria]